MRRTVLLLAAALLLLAALATGPAAAFVWQTETVDSGGSFMWNHSLKVDGAGNPSISYYDATNGDLKYAAWNGATWQPRTVDSEGDVGTATSLALDGSGNPCISYYDVTNADLKYASWDGAAWRIVALDSEGDVGGSTSLALDSAGNPHIGYYDATNGDLKYAVWDGATWQIQTVDSEGDVGGSASLALNSAGNPCIAYCNAVDGTHIGLKYAAWDGAAWQIGTVNSADAFIRGPSLALTRGDRPFISYFKKRSGNTYIGYAHLYAGKWEDRDYFGVGGAGTTTSLIMDNAGVAHISYIDAGGWHTDGGSQTLRYIVWGSFWSSQNCAVGPVGGPEDSQLGTSLALDGAGKAIISYFDCQTGELKVARPAVVRLWQTQSVDLAGSGGGDSGGGSTSLALDSAGRPRISYYDKGNSDLKYAAWTGTGWKTETVDAEGVVGFHHSIALDAAGNPRIAYLDVSNSDLKYAWRDGSGWHTETVDSVGDVGSFPSLALDSSGNPRISYCADWDLKYAWNDGGGWFTRTVDSGSESGWTPSSTSLATDNAGNPSISYVVMDMDSSDYGLKYAAWTGTNWLIDPMDSVGTRCHFNSLALDGMGNPHVSFFDLGMMENADLKYTWRDGAGWHTETVDSAGDVGRFTSLALDSAGNPRISYLDSTNAIYQEKTNLKYAMWTGTSWQIDTVDPEGCVGLRDTPYTSLALDDDGNPCISYSNIWGGLQFARGTAPPNGVPSAQPDTFATAVDTPLTVSSEAGVLVNDQDENFLTAKLATNPVHGTVVLNTDGSFTYTPAAGFRGEDAFTYVANDGIVDSAPATVAITVGTADRAPVMNEIPAQSVDEGSSLSFTVQATDPDGDPVTYAVTGLPENAGAELDPVTGTFLWSPGFDRAGTYSATFTATSGTGDSVLSDSRTVTITVNNVNRAPVAYAGVDQVLEVPGALVTLDGSGSYDEDGDPLTYMWTLRRPSGSTAVLAGETSASPTFVADKVGEYTVELVVSDGTASSAADSVTLSFANLRPIADAGPSQSVVLGEMVPLDGSGSYDLNEGDTLTYAWSIAAAPAGSAAQIGNPTAMSSAFIPDRVGSYRIQLAVSDGQLSSEPSFCEIEVVAKETQIIADIQDVEASIASLDPAAFKNPNMQNALINKLNAVLADIGALDYQEAVNKLRNDILAKTDGCVLTGAPDKNDWIEDCSTQHILYAQIQAIIDAVGLL